MRDRVPPLRSKFRCRRRAIALVGAVSVAAPVAHAETWRLLPSIGIEETLTNNVGLDPTSTRRGDLISQITPALGISGTGAHANLNGFISLPILLYVKTGADNNQVLPQVNLTGNVELIDRFLFIDGAVSVSQQFFSPFGARPEDLASATNNRYTSQVYRISPYIKGTADKVDYELRVDNIWNRLNNAPTSFDGVPVSTSDSYTNQVIGKIVREPTPFGWQVDYNRWDVRFTDQSDSQLSELGRLRLLYQLDPELQLGVSGGYEHNAFPFTSYDGAIYGLGYKWRPSALLSSEGFWEYRYFGGSYGFKLDYRTPLSVWNVDASRNVTTYPQQLGTIPAGGDVAALLNSLFSSRVGDPAQRQQLVDQVIRDRGLPSTISRPLTFYTQQVTLQEAANVTFGLLGARNSVFFSGGYLRSEPIAGSGDPLPPALAGANDNTQYTASVSWSHQLTPLVNVGANLSWIRTVPNAPILVPGETENLGTTNLTTLRVFFSTALSANTTIYGGARYQVQTSNLPLNEYNEAALVAGFRYVFR